MEVKPLALFVDKLLKNKILLSIFSLVIFGFLSTATAEQPAASKPATSSPAALKPATPEMEQTAQAISETMMSPFCPGRTISSCPSPQARDLRSQILTWLEQGNDETWIKNNLRVIYGEDVKGQPESSGFGLVGWLMPPVFVIVALLLVVLKLRNMKLSAAAQTGTPPADPDAKQKLAEELKFRLQH